MKYTSKQHHSFNQPIKPCSFDIIKLVHGGIIIVIVLVGMRGHAKSTFFSTVDVSEQQCLSSYHHLLLQFHHLFLRFLPSQTVHLVLKIMFAIITLISFLFHFVTSTAFQPDRAVFYDLHDEMLSTSPLGLPMSFPDICTSKSEYNNVIWRQGNCLKTKLHPKKASSMSPHN